MTELWHWYTLSSIFFIGLPGATVLPAGRLGGLWFSHTRGRMVGLTLMGNNVGGLALASLAGFMVTSAGWQTGFQVFGYLLLLGTLLAFLLVRDNPRNSCRVGVQEEVVGVANVQAAEASSTELLSPLPDLRVWEVLKTRQFYMLTLGIVLANFTYSAVLPQIVPHLENANLSLARASLVLSLMAAFGAMGKLIFGYLAELITARYALAVSLTLQVLGIMILINLVNSPLFWLFLPVFGIPFGGVGSLIPLIVLEAYGIRYYGRMLGLIAVATVIPAIAGPLMVGVLVDINNSYNQAFMVVIGLFSLGAVVLALTRRSASPTARASVRSPH